jgi:hypothetical protein
MKTAGYENTSPVAVGEFDAAYAKNPFASKPQYPCLYAIPVVNYFYSYLLIL